MRISDWSSDVCSSDLPCTSRRAGTGSGLSNRPNAAERRSATAVGSRPAGFRPAHAPQWREAHASEVSPGDAVAAERSEPDQGRRSEEHTSELQSLMRISYAVFCLKKKTNHNQNNTHNS